MFSQAPGIERFAETLLSGMRTRMSYPLNNTADLWEKFMPVSQQIKHRKGPECYSFEVYPNSQEELWIPARKK